MFDPSQAAGAALIIDLHAVRAGVPVAEARLEPAEAAARASRPVAESPRVRVGDYLAHATLPHLGGSVLAVGAGPDPKLVIDFAGIRHVKRASEFGLGVDLPCDAEPMLSAADLSPGQFALCMAQRDAGDQVRP